MTRRHDRERIREYWERSSPEERGKLIVGLWCNAVAATAINVGYVACLTVSARRTWRRRGQGWARATARGPMWIGLTSLALASAARGAVVRRALDHRIGSDPSAG